MSELIRTSYPDAEVIMGTATAGIAHAAMIAERLNLPMGYVRSSVKDHGRKNQIEGRISRGQKAVVVEDLISTASSVLECVNALRDEGVNVLGIASIFTYSMKKGIMNLKEAGITNNSLCDIDTLLRVAADEEYITSDDVTRILKFRDNPSDESWRN